MACEGEAQTVANLVASLATQVSEASVLSAQLMSKQMQIWSTQQLLSAAQSALAQCQMANPGG